MRHAIAVPRGSPDYPDDIQRPLTPRGKEKMRRGAKGLRRLRVEFDLILSSPYRRAKQTARIVAAVYKATDKLKLTRTLASNGDPRALVRELNDIASESKQRVMLVGHEPAMSSLLSVLLTGKTDLSLMLKKGGLCKITVKSLRYGKCAQIEWLMTPKQLRLTGKG